MRGTLDTIGLEDVLNLLGMNRKTGLLRIKGEGFQGMIHLKDGQVVHGETNRYKGIDAVYSILHCNEGSFEFLQTTSVANKETVHRHLHDLIMESARRKDTWPVLLNKYPNQDLVVFVKEENRPDTDAGLLLAGHLSVAQMISYYGLSEYDCLEKLQSLDQDKKLSMDLSCIPLKINLMKGMFIKQGVAYLHPIHEDKWSDMGIKNISNIWIRRDMDYEQLSLVFSDKCDPRFCGLNLKTIQNIIWLSDMELQNEVYVYPFRDDT